MLKATKQDDLMSELRALGNLCSTQGDWKRAEQHYRLALTLYDTCFPDDHVEAIGALLGLIAVLEQQGKKEELRKAQDQLPVLNARRRSP